MIYVRIHSPIKILSRIAPTVKDNKNTKCVPACPICDNNDILSMSIIYTYHNGKHIMKCIGCNQPESWIYFPTKYNSINTKKAPADWY